MAVKGGTGENGGGMRGVSATCLVGDLRLGCLHGIGIIPVITPDCKAKTRWGGLFAAILQGWRIILTGWVRVRKRKV